MKVLVLSPYADYLEPTIVKNGDDCIVRGEYCETSDWPLNVAWVVSFGYRKIIPERIIKKFDGRIVNIHCSALPFNRGAKPNFWSWFDDTPAGVTIHTVTPELDKGPILAQRRMFEDDFRLPGATLWTTYHDLHIAAAGLFASRWGAIKNGDDNRIFGAAIRSDEKGSYHKEGDEAPFFRCLSRGWNSPIYEVKQLGAIYRKTFK